jgi:hypothetical protein
MKTWPIIKLTFEHCASALLVGGLFALTAFLFSRMFPSDAVRWWIDLIEFALAIIVPTALAVIFLSSLLRIVLDALIATWKGFPNGNTQIVLA